MATTRAVYIGKGPRESIQTGGTVDGDDEGEDEEGVGDGQHRRRERVDDLAPAQRHRQLRGSNELSDLNESLVAGSPP